MNYKIAVDSSSDLHGGLHCAPGVSLSVVPLTLHAGDLSFVDDADLDVHAALDALQASDAAVTTSCPSPEAWASVFREADCTFAITISSELSGSYQAAVIARDLIMDECLDKKIAVIDSRATSGQMILLAQKINELIAQGLPFEQIIHQAEDYNQGLHIYYTLCSFDNLAKGGRMPKFMGTLVKKLGMRIIGTSDQGRIKIAHKCRGDRSTLMTLVNDMKHSCDLNERHVMITHCRNVKLALTLQNLILAEAPEARVTILHTHGITSYYAEDQGMIICY